MRVHRDLWMGMRAEELRAFRADGPITKSGTLGGAGDNPDVVGHEVILRRTRSACTSDATDGEMKAAARYNSRRSALQESIPRLLKLVDFDQRRGRAGTRLEC